MPEYDWTGWTDWTLLHKLDLKREVPKGSGVYVIAARKRIQRTAGTDTEGFLDIGESKGLSGRLRDFVRCATDENHKEEGHMAGWRYAFLRFNLLFPLETLHVRWVQASDKKNAYKLEGEMMLRYVARHRELPPLNYKFNWSPLEKGNWHRFDKLIGYSRSD